MFSKRAPKAAQETTTAPTTKRTDEDTKKQSTTKTGGKSPTTEANKSPSPRKKDKGKAKVEDEGSQQTTPQTASSTTKAAPRLPVFGSSLEELLAQDQAMRPHLRAPFFLAQTIKFLISKGLTVAGILKLAGSGPEVQKYQELLNAGEEIDLEQVQDVNTVASLLKAFLHALPDCLLSSSLYSKWVSIAEIEDTVECLQALAELIDQLPPANQVVLGELMHLLYLIHLNSNSTKMDASSLSSLMSKNLLWKKGERDKAGAFEDYVHINDTIRLMIYEYPLLFGAEEEERCSEDPEVTQYARFTRKLVGHTKSINCMEVTGSGWHVWSADSDGFISIWDADQMKLLAQINTEQGRILCIKSIGTNMWSGSERSLQIRDERGTLLKEEQGPHFSVVLVAGKEVWCGCKDTIKIFDAKTLELKKELPSEAYILTMASDGKYVWCGCTDKKIRVWHAKQLKLVKELEGHTRKVNALLVTDSKVWSASDDHSICIWNPKTFEKEGSGKEHKGYVFSLVSFGSYVWSCSWDKTMCLWDSSTGKPICKLSGYHADSVSTCLPVYTQKNSCWMAWSGSYDHCICIYKLSLKACTLTSAATPLVPGGTVMTTTQQFHSTLAAPSASGFQFDKSVLGTNTMLTTVAGQAGAPASIAGSERRGARIIEAEQDPTGLARWEIDPDEIKSPGNSLGTGSFGTVFKAEWHGKEVAVKKLSTQKFDDKTLEDFRKEVAIMSTLRHPNVLLFMGACTRPGNLLIVTELMPRGSVYDLLRKPEVNLSFKRKMIFAKDAALGVNWLHRSKPQFLHLDLKAANLLVDRNWTVKVADFGLSVVKKDAAEKKEKHGPIGTPLWMAPEVLMNKEYDEKADVYSFGIVLWELLCGQDPWQEIESLVDLVEAVCLEHKRPPLPKSIPQSLRDLVNACWHPEPEKRPSFEELIPRFDEIIVDGVINDTVGRALWRSRFLGKWVVSWKDFAMAFCQTTNITPPNDPTDIYFQCLKAVTCPDGDDQVTIENFSKMLEWFGPLKEQGILNRIHDLLKKAFFHGPISSGEAEKAIVNQKKGTFLLRFSSSEAGGYALTVLNKKAQLKHYRITHRPGSKYAIGKVECDSLDELMQRYRKELYLKRPCPGSKYEAMFAVLVDPKIQAVGYQEVQF
ncbi:Dual specificity protein kinase [Balamuthia mandrillaris]